MSFYSAYLESTENYKQGIFVRLAIKSFGDILGINVFTVCFEIQKKYQLNSNKENLVDEFLSTIT